MILAAAMPAWGHAYVERSSPAAGEELLRAPKTMRIWFTEALEPKASSFRLLDGRGKVVEGVSWALEEGSLAVLSLPPLGAGEYRVAYRL